MTTRFSAISVSALAMAFVMLPSTLPATAQETTSKRVKNACEADARKLCPREKANTPELNYCMEAKGRQLSRNCIRALEDAGTIPRGHFGKT